MDKKEAEKICGLKSENFQTTVNGKKTDLFILVNSKGHAVAITNYGGAIVSVMVPDKNGKLADVIQGHDNINDAMDPAAPYKSVLIGRFGNRIAKGKFTLHGKEYQLAVNNGVNHLHGGNHGWNSRVWEAHQMSQQRLALNYVSPYGEEGYTGEVKVNVEYTFTDDDELMIDYLATTNKRTIINMTNHAFFSLAGIGNPTATVDNVECQVNADFFIPIDETSIPTGEILKVEGTPFDFRKAKPIGQDINADDEQIKNGSGYDHCFVINKHEPGEMAFAAKIKEPVSGRTLEVYTTEPGVQMYTDNFTDGPKGQKGATFPRRSGVCFEAEHFPDSPNRPYFPSCVLKQGEQYHQKTIYKFGVEY